VASLAGKEVRGTSSQVLAIRQQFFIDLKHTQTYQDGSDIAQRLDNEFVRVCVSNDETKKYG
jgi:hypothetical protein